MSLDCIASDVSNDLASVSQAASGTTAASATGSLATLASDFQAMLAQLETGTSATQQPSACTGQAETSAHVLAAFGTGSNSQTETVQQALSNAITQALQAYANASAASALPSLSL
jgi:hypothetical protein